MIPYKGSRVDSKVGIVTALGPCADSLEPGYLLCKWIRSTLELANSLALRKGDWNLERTMTS